MGTSVLHIKTEVECHVYLFDEEKGIAKPGTYFNLEVRKGEQDLLFVSTEDEFVVCFKTYNVEEGDCDYRMSLEQSQFINVNADVTAKEMSSGVIDEFGVVYSHDGLQLLKCLNMDLKEYHIQDGCKAIGRMAFSNCRYLTVVILPNNMRHIGDEAFRGCENLTSITLPDSLTHIGNSAFRGCENLLAITIPASLTHIGDSAFFECKNLSAITLPNSLTHIGNCAFKGCENLTNFTLPTCLTHIGESVFFECKNISSIALPDSMTHIGNSAFRGCENLTAITFPDSLTHIGDSAFYCCGKLTAITFPDSLTYIGDCAFYRCVNLTAITFPDRLTYIGDNAFYCCGKLTSITLLDRLTHIGNRAFSGCENLTAIILPDSLAHIGVSAFEECHSLSAITLPDSLAYIGDGAFSNTGIRNVISHAPNFIFNEGCLIDKLNHRLIAYLSDKDQVSLPAGLTHIGNRAFSECRNLTAIALPTGLTHIGNSAFLWCINLTAISLPYNLKYIGNFAFSRCKNLTAVTLPAGLTHIGDFAFSYCNNLTTITLPDSLTHIGDSAFLGCNSYFDIFIPAGTRTHFETLLPWTWHVYLSEMNFNGSVPYYLFFDTKTAGVPRDYNEPASNMRNWPRLVQLGWILTDKEGNVLSQGNEIVKPEGFVISADAVRVHGITTEKAQREGKSLREVIEAFLKDVQQSKWLVGHNIFFAQQVVGEELYRMGIFDTIRTAKSLCTMVAGAVYCKIPGYYGYKSPELQELYHKLFGCNFEDAHDAMADITATKKCFFEMRRRGLI